MDDGRGCGVLEALWALIYRARPLRSREARVSTRIEARGRDVDHLRFAAPDELLCQAWKVADAGDHGRRHF